MMPFLPAVCDSCHTIFSSGIYVKKTQLHLSGFKASPCPVCKKAGHVRDGLYKFVGYTLSILKSEDTNILKLTTLHDTIILAKSDQLRQDQLEIVIKQELPKFLDLLLLLPKKKEDYMLCLHLIAQIVSAVIEISIQKDQEYEYTERPIKLYQDIKINQTIEQIYTNNTGTDRRLF